MYKETNKKQTKGDEKGIRGEAVVIKNKQTNGKCEAEVIANFA